MTERDPAYHNQAFDPPTLSWNMVLRNEPLAVNVTTALAEAVLFLRPMPGVNDQPIVDAIHSLCKEQQLELIEKGRNKPWEVAAQADWIQKMLQIVGGSSAKAVCYATDGGVLQRLEQMLVCGPGSIDQAHRKDEWVSIDQLNKAVAIYERAFRDWATV
jgi:acetylornithine deacetylase